MYEIAGDEMTIRMRETLGQWLALDEWKPQALIDWLQGYDLPATGHDDEPYLWLLRGLPPADERYELQEELANRVGRILEDSPDESRPGTRPDQMLYNLLMLSAGLNCPDSLADPLYKMLLRGKLKGEWLGVQLNYALRVALALNQLDDRLQPQWEVMLQERRHDFLDGDELDGFEGIRLMPPSADRRGEPALDAIGKALRVIAIHLETEDAPTEEFRSLINRIVETYPGRPTWNLDLLHQANKSHWPDWAMHCFLGLENIPREDARQLRDTLRRSPYSSARAIAGIVAHFLTNFEGKLGTNDPVKQAVEEAHVESLRSLAVCGS